MRNHLHRQRNDKGFPVPQKAVDLIAGIDVKNMKTENYQTELSQKTAQ